MKTTRRVQLDKTKLLGFRHLKANRSGSGKTTKPITIAMVGGGKVGVAKVAPAIA